MIIVKLSSGLVIENYSGVKWLTEVSKVIDQDKFYQASSSIVKLVLGLQNLIRHQIPQLWGETILLT